MLAAFALDGHNYHPDRLWRRANCHIHARRLRYRGKHTRPGLITYSATHSNPGNSYASSRAISHTHCVPNPDYPRSDTLACFRRDSNSYTRTHPRSDSNSYTRTHPRSDSNSYTHASYRASTTDSGASCSPGRRRSGN